MNSTAAARIQVRHSADGVLPPGVVLASIHHARRGPGWYAITPGGVAHGPYSGNRALSLARQWIHNFIPGDGRRIDWSFCQPHVEYTEPIAVAQEVGVGGGVPIVRQPPGKSWVRTVRARLGANGSGAGGGRRGVQA